MSYVRSDRQREPRVCVTAHEMSRRRDMAAALLDRAITAGHHGDMAAARRWVGYAAELHGELLNCLMSLRPRAVFIERAAGMAAYLRREADAWRAMMH